MVRDFRESLFYELVRPHVEQETATHRAAAAQAVAESFGARSFMLFLYDGEVNALLPAPGFPQTLIAAGRWQNFLREVLNGKPSITTLPDPATGEELPACGIRAHDRSIGVFLDCTLTDDDTDLVRSYLPFVAAALRGEDAALRARGEVRAAQLASRTAEHLAQTLDKTRGALQHALHDAAKANRSKDEFLAIVSHELRAPLTAILGWSQILIEGGLKPEDSQMAFKTIERSAKVQAELIEDLLDYGRVISGKVRLTMQKVLLAEILAAAVQTVEPAAQTRGVAIIQNIDPNVGEISGDPSRLQQIVWNLLTNAIKFTNAGGTIEVALSREETGVILTVSDTGKGIAHDFLPYVFERFRQADASTTRQTGGLGLGLAIVKNLVEMHGAHIEASSDGLGKGSTFTIHFPLSLPPVVVETKAAANESANGKATQAIMPLPDTRSRELRKTVLAAKRILVVDDNADARGLLDSLLTRSGGAVTPAESAQEVLSLLESFNYDILISDIEMPEMDGFTLIKTIRERELATGHRMPAIALSAHARQADKDHAIKMGFDHHMSKPFDPARLIDRIVEVTAGAIA